MTTDPRSLRDIAKSLKDGGMRCNCDLDNWEPDQSSGHSWVCRIHKTAFAMKYEPHDFKERTK